jgi:hypothetical protein
VSKTERLAAALLADRERPTNHHNIIPCFVCAYKFVYRGRQGELNGRFCSMRCQDWYGAGNKPINEEIVYRWRDGRPMRMGPKGFYIDCAYCQKEFESLGLRCCSVECERSYHEREENLAVMAEAGIEPKARRRNCISRTSVIDAPAQTWQIGRQTDLGLLPAPPGKSLTTQAEQAVGGLP